jgi:hypothetical protein
MRTSLMPLLTRPTKESCTWNSKQRWSPSSRIRPWQSRTLYTPRRGRLVPCSFSALILLVVVSLCTHR